MEQSAEEIVATSDSRAVRMAFDERNAGWLRIVLSVSVAYLVVVFFVSLAHQRGVRAIEVIANIAVNVTVLYSLNEKRRGRVELFVRAHIPAVVIAMMILQLIIAVLLAPNNTDNAIAAITCFSWAMIGFRLLPAELLLLHGSLCAVGIAEGTLMPRQRAQFIAASIFMNAIPLFIGLIASRRRRRDILATFRERKRHAAEVVRMRDELQYAREIQLSMLPDESPALDWIDVAGVSIPATEVGGDYYDYFVVGDRLAIVSGDVAGHGLASGIVLATLRSGFTLLRDSLTDPAGVLARLHDLVAETSRRRTLVTCAVLLLDRAKKRATIANAGHPPIIVKRAASEVETIDLFTPPLGVRLSFDIASREMPIGNGDVFVLHTDGIYEATNAQGESYGVERLVALVASSTTNAAQLRDIIVQDVERFRGSEKQRDDITVVVATIRAC